MDKTINREIGRVAEGVFKGKEVGKRLWDVVGDIRDRLEDIRKVKGDVVDKYEIVVKRMSLNNRYMNEDECGKIHNIRYSDCL